MCIPSCEHAIIARVCVCVRFLQRYSTGIQIERNVMICSIVFADFSWCWSLHELHQEVYYENKYSVSYHTINY